MACKRFWETKAGILYENERVLSMNRQKFFSYLPYGLYRV